MGTGSQVILSGGVTAANIFWQVGSSATIGTTAIFQRNHPGLCIHHRKHRAAMNGRALAQTGTVTLDTNTMVNPGPAYTGGTPPALALTCPLATAHSRCTVQFLAGGHGRCAVLHVFNRFGIAADGWFAGFLA